MANVRIKYNRSLKMSPGKMAAQAVHAALRAYGIEHGSVVVLEGSATQVNQMDVQINDAGWTEVEPGSLTAGASLVHVDGYDDKVLADFQRESFDQGAREGVRAAASTVEEMCHWRQNIKDVQLNQSHDDFHFGYPCPYESMAAVLRGQKDPRD